MSSSTSTIARRRRLAARLAAASVLAAGAGFATATAASAAPCQGSTCSQYSGSIVISSSLSLFPSAGTFSTLTVAPGAGQLPITPFVLDVDSTDSAGADLTVLSDANNSPNLPFSDFATDTWSAASTPVKGQSPFASGPVSVYSLTAPTGGIASHCATNQPVSVPCTVGSNGYAINGQQQPAGSDILPLGLWITVPSGTPGSPASGYSTAFDYALTGA